MFADSFGSIEGSVAHAPRVALWPMLAPMIVILFQCEGDVRPLSVRREATLRDVQKQLCTMFRRPFPKTKCLLDVAGVQYEDFIEKPFEVCVDFTPCRIYFEPTDDPYFYDLVDRRSTSKLTLHEELEMEAEMGDTLPRGGWPSGPSSLRPAREHYGEIPVFSPLMHPTDAAVDSLELRQSSSGE